MGGPLVNKIGVKWALVLGSLSFPIQGSAYYCNSKFGNQWVSYTVKECFGRLKSDIYSEVPHSQRCNQRHGHGLLVCRRGRSHHDTCTNRCSWKVFGSVDCIAESRAVGWRRHQVSPKLYKQVVILTILSVSQRTTRREQMEALPRTPMLHLW